MTTDTIKLIDGRTLEGRYDDTWSGRDYGTGSLRRVRFITSDGVAHILHGTSMSDRMREVGRRTDSEGRPLPARHDCPSCGKRHGGRFAMCGGCRRAAFARGE